MNNLLVFSASFPGGAYDAPLLVRSARACGVEVVFYGEGRNWPGMCAGKLTEAANFLKTRSEELALFTDAFDSILVGGEEKILDGWRRAGAPDILIQGHWDLWPDGSFASKFARTPTGLRFVCAGGWMGRRLALIPALEMLGARDNDDQLLWNQAFVSGELGDARIDSEYDVFQLMGRKAAFESASVLHWGGRAPGMEKEFEKRYGKVSL